MTMRRRLSFLLLLFCWLPLAKAQNLPGAITYAVDNLRTYNGTGTELSPWQDFTNINWETIRTSLNSDDVYLYLSCTRLYTNALNIAVSNYTHTLYVIGWPWYNILPSGNAIWLQTNNPIQHATIAYEALYIDSGHSNIVIYGVNVVNSNPGGIVLAQGDYSSNPGSNLWNITIDNCAISYIFNNGGITCTHGRTNVHDITIRNCSVNNAAHQAIYLGASNYFGPTITNCIVEGNWLYDNGVHALHGHGEIQISGGCYGAIVRSNVNFRSAPTTGASCGVKVYASDCQIYGNWFYKQASRLYDSLSGSGIVISADGDGSGTGRFVNNTRIFNNVIFRNEGNGIYLNVANTSVGGVISNTLIWNNTIVSNTFASINIFAGTLKTNDVAQIRNNISSNWRNIAIAGTTYLRDCNRNLYCATNTDMFSVAGSTKTWAQWQALGYDLNGYNTDPMFVNAPTNDFRLSPLSPVRQNGYAASFFSTDIVNFPRLFWSYGAYEALSIENRVINLRVGTIIKP